MGTLKWVSLNGMREHGLSSADSDRAHSNGPSGLRKWGVAVSFSRTAVLRRVSEVPSDSLHILDVRLKVLASGVSCSDLGWVAV
jgi:hypothetical protein